MKLPDNKNSLTNSIKRVIDLFYLYAVVWGIAQVVAWINGS